MKELNFQEQAFKALYLQSFNATKAALEAGYAESVAKTRAWEWVSLTQCPVNKRHLRDAIQAEIDQIYGEEQVDRGWLLRRAKLLVEFSVGKFIRQTGSDAVYDFSTATADDWWCIEEYVTEQTYRQVARGEPVPVDKLKIKTPSKISALKLLGDHVDVQAFKENVEHSGSVTQVNMTADEYKHARAEAMAHDDC